MFDGEIELDESYFDGVRKDKVIVFGLLKRHGKVCTAVVNDTQTGTLMPIISSKIKPDSVVYTDLYRPYNALDVSRFHHHHINHSTDFAKDENHINGIENFFSQAKRILRKYKGIHKASFPPFLTRYSSKNVRSGSTMEHPVSNSKSCETGVKSKT